MSYTVSLCPELLFNRRQPLAGFVTEDGEPAFFCARCFPARIEEALLEGMTPDDITANISFTRCGHVEDGTGTCGRCAKAITAMLVFVSMQQQLKPIRDAKRGKRFDEVIRLLIKQHGRINVDSVYTRQHGKAL